MSMNDVNDVAIADGVSLSDTGHFMDEEASVSSDHPSAGMDSEDVSSEEEQSDDPEQESDDSDVMMTVIMSQAVRHW